MPGYDRSGPMGQGPMTGGGFGRCVSQGDAPNMIGYGRGMRRGRGGGRGFARGRGFGRANWGMMNQPVYNNAPAMEPAPEPESLQARAEDLRRELAEIESRLDAMKDTLGG
jgi:hypothetical protein